MCIRDRVNSFYKNSLINYINKINGRVYDISLNESNNTYRLKGCLLYTSRCV